MKKFSLFSLEAFLILILMTSNVSGSSTKVYNEFNPISIKDMAEFSETSLRLSSSHLKYKYTGSVSENSDGDWDDNEYEFYEFDLDNGDYLEAELTTNVDRDIFIFIMKGDEPDDIEKIVSNLVYYGWDNDLYDADYIEFGFASVSAYMDFSGKISIAVFSYGYYSFSSTSYTLRTNHEADEFTFVDFLIIAAIIGIIIYLIVKYKNRNNSRRYGYNPGYPAYGNQGYNNSYNQNYNQQNQYSSYQGQYDQRDPYRRDE